MDVEEKATELPADVAEERERIRLALVAYSQRGYSYEIKKAWARAYPGVELYGAPAEPGPVSEAVLAERRRVADEMVKLAREEDWCSAARDVWRDVMPGVEFRDKDGFDCDGFNAEGKHRYDLYPETRPVQPEGTTWCSSCRRWEPKW